MAPTPATRSAIVVKRDNAIQMLEEVQKWLDEKAADPTATQLEVHRSDLEHWNTMFSENQEKIEVKAATESILAMERETARKFRAEYLELKSQFLEALDKLTPKKPEAKPGTSASSSQPGTNAATSYPFAGYHLRPIQSVEFSGDRLKYHLFRQKFESIYGKKQPYTDTERLIFLQDACKGEAFEKIQGLEPCDENYTVALDLLNIAYEDVQLSCTDHVAALFNLPTVAKDDVAGLRKFVDQFNMHLRALASFDRPVDQWCDLVIHLAKTKLDRFLVLDWQKECQDDRFPCHNTFIKFLLRRCQMLERANRDSHSRSAFKSNVSSNQKKSEQSKPGFKSRAATLAAADAPRSAEEGRKPCQMCKGTSHFLQRCRQFVQLTVGQRLDTVRRLRVCMNCLRDHASSDCKSKSRCLICQQEHHTMLHADTSNVQQKTTETPNRVSQDENHSTTAIVSEGESALVSTQQRRPNKDKKRIIALPTALVNVRGREEFVKRLRLTRIRYTQSIAGVGQSTLESKWLLSLVIQSRTSYFWTELEAHVVPTITGFHPAYEIARETLNIPESVQLADPNFGKPQRIDLLIGAGKIDCELLDKGESDLANPYLLNTKLGLIVAGRVPIAPTAFSHVVSTPSEAGGRQSMLAKLSEQMQRFWEIEEGEYDPKSLSPDELAAEQHFSETVQRLLDGRFMVRLPFKESTSTLGDSRRAATRCFLRLERAMEEDEELRCQYSAFIREFIELGHMQLARPDQLDGPNFYLPHHHVARPERSSTKLRVVFNGSARSSSHKSLNELLLAGPVIQSELFAIVIRARLPAFVLSADIVKMFRQIAVHPDDQRFQLVLWRDTPKEPIRTYAINRVVYGLACSPFLATRCIKWLAEENATRFPLAARALVNDCYVDNILSGCDDLETARKLCSELQEVLRLGQFHLHKWCSNDDRGLDSIPSEQREKRIHIDETLTGVKTLGLIWDGLDNFRYVVDVQRKTHFSKRDVLSEIARIFDPLNLASPAIVPAKQFMQVLWKEKVDWDKPIEETLLQRWHEHRNCLPALKELVIPRLIRPPHTEISLHCFVDASSKSYGAAVYVVALRDDDPVTCRLLCAKSRVAPLKVKTIARLELCAALLGAELVRHLVEIISINGLRVDFWTDSEIVLHWLAKPAHNWEIFVSHRVQKIHYISSADQWHFVPTDQNPADLVSRGVSPPSLLAPGLWLNGPPFLLRRPDQWPHQPDFLARPAPEEKKCQDIDLTLVVAAQRDLITETRIYTSFSRLLHTFAWIGRWRENGGVKDVKKKARGPLTVLELDFAQRLLVRHVQFLYFAAEIEAIRNRRELPRKSRLLSLNPKLDRFGVLRVGGRLQNADIEDEAKQPAILPTKHPLTTAIFRHYHLKLLHAGPKSLFGHVRNYFWPLRGLIVARRIIKSCVVCFRSHPSLMEQQMGPLPACRVRRAEFPFYEVGVDYAGPFPLAQGGRGRATLKLYVAFFVCMSTRAVHLETVLDLTTEGFIATLRRFVARRGLCKRIHSDNMKAFVGAKTELGRLYEALGRSSPQIQDKIAPVQWSFIPPRVPHQGGIWEASVKSTKFHLKRCLPTSPLKLDEWNTLLFQIEAILNSRPIAPLSQSPDDIGALTPGHFIAGAPLLTLPEASQCDKRIDSLTRWRRVQAVRDHFWQKWSLEYLQTLQTRAKWQKEEPSVKLNSIVLIKDDQAPPQQWRYGLVTRLHPGRDALVRIVTIRSDGKEFLRDIRIIAPLPIDEDDIWPTDGSPTEAGMSK